MNDTDCLPPLHRSLAMEGYARIAGRDLLRHLSIDAGAWRALASSWNDLGPDLYMADGGRYRRRRHAAFALDRGRFVRKPHQPHYQSRDYNRLNGDVQRWFDPVADDTVALPAMQAILAFCNAGFPASPSRRRHVEMHQFRIEASAAESGQPTPEGMHRDGVDHVLVMLIERHNVREGVTRIGAADGSPLGEFTLTDPGDAMLIDDRRILHGVTAIHPVDPALPAWRDALVVTLAAE